MIWTLGQRVDEQTERASAGHALGIRKGKSAEEEVPVRLWRQLCGASNARERSWVFFQRTRNLCKALKLPRLVASRTFPDHTG